MAPQEKRHESYHHADLVELPDDHYEDPTAATTKSTPFRKVALISALAAFVWVSCHLSLFRGPNKAMAKESLIHPELMGLNQSIQGRVWWSCEGNGFAEAARVWRQDAAPPLAVIEVATEQDVQLSMITLQKLWQDYGVPFRIRSGGHSKAGFSTVAGGIVLSLKHLKGRSIHSFASDKKKTALATLEPGARVEDVLDSFLELASNNNQTNDNELYAGSLGQCGKVAEGGWVLGGGVGFMARLLGLGVDNVLEFRVVLANGTLVVCNHHEEHSDLFWALRGAGQGNYGVVTSMTYQLHLVPDTQLFRTVAIPIADMGDFLFRLGNLNTDKEFFVVLGGREGGMMTAYMSWFSMEMDIDKNTEIGNHHFEQNIRPILPHTAVLPDDTYESFLWAESTHQLFDQGYGTDIYAAQPWNGYLMPVNNTQEVWETITKIMATGMKMAPDLEPHIELWGGAISEVDFTETAFPYRDAVYNVGVLLVIQDYDETAEERFKAQVTSVNAWWPQVAQYLTGSYINYPMNSLRSDEYPRLYWGGHLERLVNIKQIYDPSNTFVHEQSVPMKAF